MKDTIQRSVLRKPDDPILIVEDTPETQELLIDICEDMELDVHVADNGKEALELIEQYSYSLFLVDLMMPVMDGKTFIPLLLKKMPEACIIVQSALDSPNTIIEIMKMGVHDYVLKPIDPDHFTSVMTKALEHQYLKECEKRLSLNAGKKIRNHMEWLAYKENRRIIDKEYAEIKSIHNIRTSLFQGAGFGVIVPMIDLLKNTVEEKDNLYVVDKDILEFIFKNNEHLRKQAEGLHEIAKILDETFDLEEKDASSLCDALPQAAAALNPFLERKETRITYPDLQYNCTLMINIDKVLLAVEELLINAYKYCTAKSAINIFTRISEGYFWISVKNDVTEKERIPEQCEKLVIEPFYRILPPDESVAGIERFGMGLGLSVVDNVARKHQGSFFIKSYKDLTAKDDKDCVIADILIPILQK